MSISKWTIDEKLFADCQSSSRAGEFLTRRLNLLSKETVKLLSTGAVLGKTFDLDAVIELTGASAIASMECINEARKRHLVWMHGHTWTFYHDKIREALLAGLSHEKRCEVHLRAAEYLIRTKTSCPGRVAIHFDAAGDFQRALPFALQAGVDAQEQNLPATAELQLRIAERASHATDVDLATKSQIHSRLGHSLMLIGEYEEAGQHLSLALSPRGR